MHFPSITAPNAALIKIMHALRAPLEIHIRGLRAHTAYMISSAPAPTREFKIMQAFGTVPEIDKTSKPYESAA
jgi:hypothetical protein